MKNILKYLWDPNMGP